MKKYLLVSLIIISLGSVSLAQLTITAESGAALNGYNDVRYSNAPNNQGTLFSLTEDFGDQQLIPYIRVEAKYQFAERHIVEATAAPLAFEYSRLTGSVDFGDDTYGGDEVSVVNARYEFNTYRLSYRYLVADAEKWRVALGATVLMRDARIALTQGAKSDETTDLGFVPLLSFDVRYRVTPPFHLVLKGDALVGPQGRAEDVFVGMDHSLWNLKPGLSYRFGYRIIEGGADVDQVYNFSLIHFAAVGVSYLF